MNEFKFKIGDQVLLKDSVHFDPSARSRYAEVTRLLGSDSFDQYEVLLTDLDIIQTCRDEHLFEISEIVTTAAKDAVSKHEPQKFNKDKPMMNLVRPEFIKAIAEGLTFGATKYEEQRGDIPNYLRGQGFHYSTILDSLERHINAFKSGVDVDEESGVHHLALAAVNLMFLHTYEISDKGVDDRVVLNEKK